MKSIGWMIAAAGLATAATAASAQPLPPRGPAPPAIAISDFDEPYAAAPRRPRMLPGDEIVTEVLTPDEIVAIARDEGFSPLGIPRQRGVFYTLAAINPDGDDGRLVIDGRSGRLVRFMPAWQMGDAMEAVTVASYGRIQGLPRIVERNPPRPPRPVGRVAGRSQETPLPRPAPPQPAGARAAAETANAAMPAAPAKDAVKPQTDDTPKREAAMQPSPAAAPAASAAATEAKPSFQPRPTEPMPPVQGLD